MNPNDRCIAPAALITGHALSYTDQPYFQNLIDTLRKPQRPLVLVAGAGVSMAAGLPSWLELVEGVENKLVPDKILSAFRALNSSDLERRSDLVLFLSGDQQSNKNNVKHIREALYRDNSEPEPSAVAEAIAQLASVYQRRISVITTNFDEVLESAMGQAFESVSSFSFENWETWTNLADDDHRASVMHLHGLIYAEDRTSLGPLVLSESDFRLHGPEIQNRLAELLRGSDVLLVGASLADRNITTPLALSKNNGASRFAVLTPTLHRDDLTTQICAEVAVWQADSMRKALGVKPILLKCHSQVAQIVTECALASHEPKMYRRTGAGVRKSKSLHYGTRFNLALGDAYSALGASPRDGSMREVTGVVLSNRLQELTFRRNGPDARLKELRKRYKGRCADDENIGIFVWLRDLPQRTDSTFGLRLLVSSAYAHWRSWSAFRVEPIYSGSRNAAVQAAYGGRTVFLDVPRERHSGSWQGAWAQPLLVGYTSTGTEAAGLPLDQLHLGAVSVNTDRRVTSQNPVDDAPDLSVLMMLTQEELAWFRESVDETMVSLFD
ncbi:hypothetical protein GCM10023153_16780 [Ornithinibacter aureus]|uniref:SIR2-like domain-containing protein n=1 Tax=Ornithinibacter aureus TaxID=622664 RepID=A0ABP8JRS4_9MICO|nr:SIR2 family protein [Ornithinibacter aureus]KAF0834356.1 SIR2-like protein [Ornithinibacter aureus]